MVNYEEHIFVMPYLVNMLISIKIAQSKPKKCLLKNLQKG